MPSHGEDGRLERLAHAAERRAFNLIGGGETLERADVLHTADGKRRDGAARGVNADKKVVPDHEYRTENLGKHHAEQHAVTENLFAASEVTCAVVLAGEGNSRLREGVGNIVGEILEIQCER